jgi:5'-deoxynucleotidase
MDLTLTQLMRVGHLKRWHMVRTTREQTLAEHITLVQVISLDVVARLGIQRAEPTQFLQEQVRRWAYWHDMPEVLTGDISPPFKMMADREVRGLMDSLERSTDSRYAAIMDATCDTAHQIVKFADMLEAMVFLRAEGIGPRAVEIVGLIGESLGRVVGEVGDPVLAEVMLETRAELMGTAT